MSDNSLQIPSLVRYGNATRISQNIAPLIFITLGFAYLMHAVRVGVPTQHTMSFAMIFLVCAACLTAGINTGLSTMEPQWGWNSVPLRRVALVSLVVTSLSLLIIALKVTNGQIVLYTQASYIANLWISGVILVLVFYPIALAVRHKIATLWPLTLLPGITLFSIHYFIFDKIDYYQPLVNTGLCLMVIWLTRADLWAYRIMRELDAARVAEKHIGIMEERLRFSRDLHDVLGQTLSAIAIKSELAAQLAIRSDERAVAEMLSVHDLAHQTLAETRKVVTGYRSADLYAEVHGARSLLAAARINCTVEGDIEVVPEELADTFAWVVRESVTNVVRHAQADTCTISFALSRNTVTLTVISNGAADGYPSSTYTEGNGLRGLRERLDMAGGNLLVIQEEDKFIVQASAPILAVQTVAATLKSTETQTEEF